MRSSEFHPLAVKELEEALAHYESLYPGKGLELMRQTREAIAQTSEFPRSAPVVRSEVRSLVIQPTTRWHYTLYYRVKTESVRILAFAHQSRAPFYWLGRK